MADSWLLIGARITPMALSVSTSASFQQTTLDNGLRVLLREVRERPLVGVWMWYRVGGRNELPGTTGVSHWVEHMLFKGGKRFGKGEITKGCSCRSVRPAHHTG